MHEFFSQDKSNMCGQSRHLTMNRNGGSMDNGQGGAIPIGVEALQPHTDSIFLAIPHVRCDLETQRGGAEAWQLG